MKKIILSLLAICLANAFAFSQCSKTYTGTGVYPSQLPDAYEQVQYSQEVDFTFPVDTTVQSFSIHIDSMRVDSVNGFPGTNFTFKCSTSDCSYIYKTGMTYYQGCFMINGYAPKNAIGTYKLKVYLRGYFQTPLGAQEYPVADSSVNFTVKACNISAKVTAAGNTAICVGDTVKLTASGANKFQWLNKNNKLANDTLANLTVTDSGMFRALVWDATTGCFDTSTTTKVTVFAMPAKPSVAATATTVTTTATGVTYQWYKDSTLIGGAILQTYSPTSKGKYKVKVISADGCGTFSDLVDYYNSAITDIAGLSLFNVFPNPASNNANIEFTSPAKQAIQLSIIDINGKIIMLQNINANPNKNNIAVDLTSYTKGIYIVKLQTNNGQQTQRLTVE